MGSSETSNCGRCDIHFGRYRGATCDYKNLIIIYNLHLPETQFLLSCVCKPAVGFVLLFVCVCVFNLPGA